MHTLTNSLLSPRGLVAAFALSCSLSGCGGGTTTPIGDLAMTADLAMSGDMALAPDLAVTKPNAPSNLKAVPLGGGAHLTWKDNSTDEDGFMIMRKDGMAAYMMVTTVPFNTTAFHDTPLTSKATYSYLVHAMKGDTLSDQSNEVTLTLP